MQSKAFLETNRSFKLINNSQLNTSKSKQAYSFTKTSRFIDPKPVVNKTTYTQEVIQRPSKKKGVGIGYGKKWNFEKLVTETPTSWKYNITPSFEQMKQHKKGCSFSLGRQKVQFGSYISKQKIKTPSVDKYTGNLNSVKTKAPKFTMRKKVSLSQKQLGIQALNNNPGPGAYENNPEQSSFQSRLRLSKFTNLVYGVNRSPRFKTDQTLSPGPGKYYIQKTDGSEGKSVNSQFRTSQQCKFPTQKKESSFEKGAKISFFKPGPGSYQLPSDFGIYSNNKFQRKQTQVSILND